MQHLSPSRIHRAVGETIRKRLRQNSFDSPVHEAILNLIVAAAHVRDRLDASCARHGISGAQYNVLRILKGAHPEGHTRGDIACRLLDRAPDVTRLIDRLEREGLVERVRTETDKRLSITRITRKGLRLLDTLKPEIDRDTREFAQRLSPNDATELSRICEGLYASDHE